MNQSQYKNAATTAPTPTRSPPVTPAGPATTR